MKKADRIEAEREREVARLVAFNAILAENRIFGFCQPRDSAHPEYREPNGPQRALLEAWRDPGYKVFTYSGANRIGKCVTYGTLIDTPAGEVAVGDLFEGGRSFDVWAWDGCRRVVARAGAPFRKPGIHLVYRITMTDGRWVEAADDHLIFCSDGEYRTVSKLAVGALSYHPDTSVYSRTCSESPVQTIGERCLSVHDEGVRSSGGTLSGCRDGCSGDFRRCGERPLSVTNIGPVSSPLSTCVLRPCAVSWHLDDLEHRRTNSHRPVCVRPSILDGLRRCAGRFFEYLTRGVCNTAARCFGLFQAPLQFAPAGVFLLQPFGGFVPRLPEMSGCDGKTTCLPYSPPLFVDGNSIISIKPIGVKVCYDFEVEKYHNYFAGGLIHHNTFIGGLMAVCTCAGEWLWSGEKMVSPHDRPRKVRYVGQSWEGHVKAVVEPTLKFWWPKLRGVETKKNNQGIEAYWLDKRTKSSIEVMSNVQDSSVFEGWEGDLVIYDEPPKREVRVACARGLIDRRGRELFCMTLLKEAWIHREVVMARLPDGKPDMSVFNVNGDIYSNVGYGLTAEGIEQFSKTLTEDEKQARLLGKPSYMSSLVCPKLDRKKHVREIPVDRSA